MYNPVSHNVTHRGLGTQPKPHGYTEDQHTHSSWQLSLRTVPIVVSATSHTLSIQSSLFWNNLCYYCSPSETLQTLINLASDSDVLLCNSQQMVIIDHLHWYKHNVSSSVMDIGVLLHNHVLPHVMFFQAFMSFILPLLRHLNARKALL